jgi:hypothetical protein
VACVFGEAMVVVVMVVVDVVTYGDGPAWSYDYYGPGIGYWGPGGY